MAAIMSIMVRSWCLTSGVDRDAGVLEVVGSVDDGFVDGNGGVARLAFGEAPVAAATRSEPVRRVPRPNPGVGLPFMGLLGSLALKIT